MRLVFAAIMVLAAALPAAAQGWYARGEFNGWGTDNPMVDQGGGHYTATVPAFVGVPSEFKLARSDWSQSSPNSNGKVMGDANNEIRFHLYESETWTDGWYPKNSRRVGYEDPLQHGWEIVGSFNGWSAAADPTYSLTAMGTGLYHGQFAMNPGFYEFKFRNPGDPVNQDPSSLNGISIGQDFGKDSGNNSFRVWSAGDLWNFDLDLPNGRWRAYTNAPSPDLDNNNKVDARDYVLWRNNDGSAAGYNVWRANFGFNLPWYARGSFGAGANPWDDLSFPMVDEGDGHLTRTITGLAPGTLYYYKVAHADFSGAVPGSNGEVPADASGKIKLHFYELDGGTWGDGWSPASSSRVGYDDSQVFDWELMGSYNGWSTPFLQLTDQGNGLHTGQIQFATPGTIEFKFRQQGSWDTSIGGDFGDPATNISINVLAANDTWNFELDLPHGRWRAYQQALAGLGAGEVPEPASLALVMMGVALGLGRARRK